MGLVSRTISGSPVARTLLLLLFAVILVVAATAYGQIRLNGWNRPFYDALSRRDLRDFLYQLGVFFIIAGVLLVFNVLQRWLVETLELKLREGLVQGLLRDWMQPGRAFWLANSGQMGVNPDQRIHEDSRKLCELSADLGVGLLQASILFLTFSGVQGFRFPRRRVGLYGARPHGMGGHRLRRHRLAVQLLGRPGSHRA
jgi:vitamin B12/bleomycin/antimicrobial peptide transport system ATP-binding/permease protein